MGLEDELLEEDYDEEIEAYVEASISYTDHSQISAFSSLSRQMDQYSQLSPADQQKCVKRYVIGIEAKEMLESGAESDELLRLVEDGRQAQAEILGSMFRLVTIIARESAVRRYGTERGLAMIEDLVAEAQVSLLESLPKYAARTDAVPFATYAARVVRDKVRHLIDRHGGLDVPSGWMRMKRVASSVVPALEYTLGRKPTTVEIQAALLEKAYEWAYEHLTDEQKQLSPEEQAIKMTEKLKKQGMLGAINRYDEVMAAMSESVSIHAKVGEDSEVGDFIADSTDGGLDELELEELKRDIAAALSELGDRERDIIMYRFGLVDGTSWTYAKLAPKYGISAERVRQIEAGVMEKLRSPRFASLSVYVTNY